MLVHIADSQTFTAPKNCCLVSCLGKRFSHVAIWVSRVVLKKWWPQKWSLKISLEATCPSYPTPFYRKFIIVFTPPFLLYFTVFFLNEVFSYISISCFCIFLPFHFHVLYFSRRSWSLPINPSSITIALRSTAVCRLHDLREGGTSPPWEICKAKPRGF